MIIFRLVLLTCLATCSTSAFALDMKYYAGHLNMFERTERYESVFGGAVTYLRPSGHDEFEPPSDAILIEGVLSQETLAHVRRLLPREHGFLIYLDSPGGDLDVGITLGRLFRERESIAVSSRRAQCKSACALAFLGATTRFLLGEPGALGFHRQYRLVRGQVTYGNPTVDLSTIAAYLDSISFRGISAEEITSTTGEATFSESALKERGLVTLTREELRAHYKTMLSYSGITAFEALSFACSKYDHVDPRGAPIEVMVNVFTCGSRTPALREPQLLGAAFSVSRSVQEKLLSRSDTFQVLRSADPAVIEAFNREAETEPGSYQRWLARRQAIRDRLTGHPAER